MEKISLQKFGLTEKEETVYLTLLANNSLTANDIATKCGIHRQVAYDVLARLLDKGLVSSIQNNSKKVFSAMPPKRLLDEAKENNLLLEKMLPQLSLQINSRKEDALVSVVRGKNSVKEVIKLIQDKMEEGAREHLVMGVDDKMYMKYAPIPLKKFMKFLEEKNLRERVLAMEGEKYFAGEKRSLYKFIPKEFFNPTATHIAGDLVAILIWTNPPTAIIIENKETADAYRKYFNLLWKVAKTKKWRSAV